MKSFKAIFILFLTISIINGCRKEPEHNESSLKEINKQILASNDQQTLNSRVKKTDQILQVLNLYDGFTKSEGIPPKVDLTKNYVFKLRAEVDPPTFEGNTLQATHVKITDHFAFVTYNTRGDKYLGGLDIFDVNDIKNPTIIYHAIFKNADVSSVDYCNNKLYIVGAVDIDSDKPAYIKRPAILEVISLNANKEFLKVDTIIDLKSFAGTDVKIENNIIYTTSGSDGYFTAFNQDYTIKDSVKLDNARAIDANSDNIYVLQGQPGRITIYNKANASYIGTYNVGAANQEQAKSELAVSDKYIFAALNEGGVKMMELNGSEKQILPKPPTPQGELDDNYVSNSVSLHGDLVLVANGEAGLYIGGMVEKRNDSIAMLGRIKFREHESANFIEAKDSIIFVATGLGGLKILSLSIDDGVPPDVIPTKPCPTLYTTIMNYFPEYWNNKNRYPELFASTINKRILLTKESEVYVTFISEGAGWKNSFGYYTYNVNNPPTDASTLNKTILFPNVSLVGEGGGLDTGDMVQVGKTKFPAGTVIGFYLISDGWKNGLVTDGRYTNYTDPNLNIAGHQQHLLFKEKTCGDLVMTFEDIDDDDHIPWWDNDFNDIIFVISDSKEPSKAITNIDLTNIPEK